MIHPERVEHAETGLEAGHQPNPMKLRGGRHLTGSDSMAAGLNIVEARSTWVHFVIASSIRRSQLYTASLLAARQAEAVRLDEACYTQ